jgi:hypothetical protein
LSQFIRDIHPDTEDGQCRRECFTDVSEDSCTDGHCDNKRYEGDYDARYNQHHRATILDPVFSILFHLY